MPRIIDLFIKKTGCDEATARRLMERHETDTKNYARIKKQFEDAAEIYHRAMDRAMKTTPDYGSELGVRVQSSDTSDAMLEVAKADEQLTKCKKQYEDMLSKCRKMCKEAGTNKQESIAYMYRYCKGYSYGMMAKLVDSDSGYKPFKNWDGAKYHSYNAVVKVMAKWLEDENYEGRKKMYAEY